MVRPSLEERKRWIWVKQVGDDAQLRSYTLGDKFSKNFFTHRNQSIWAMGISQSSCYGTDYPRTHLVLVNSRKRILYNYLYWYKSRSEITEKEVIQELFPTQFGFDVISRFKCKPMFIGLSVFLTSNLCQMSFCGAQFHITFDQNSHPRVNEIEEYLDSVHSRHMSEMTYSINLNDNLHY